MITDFVDLVLGTSDEITYWYTTTDGPCSSVDGTGVGQYHGGWYLLKDKGQVLRKVVGGVQSGCSLQEIEVG